VAEYVQLVDRPGRFFVVSRALGRVQLLGPDDEELSVGADQVKKATPATKRSQVIRAPQPAVIRDFAQYGDLVKWLITHRDHVYFHVCCPEELVPRICDRYLDLTGEELNPSFISRRQLVSREGKKNWNAASMEVVFPKLPPGTLAPSPVRIQSMWCEGPFRYEELACSAFIWYLFEHHGFRIIRRKRCKEIS
jgi:hypothetical protein